MVEPLWGILSGSFLIHRVLPVTLDPFPVTEREKGLCRRFSSYFSLSQRVQIKPLCFVLLLLFFFFSPRPLRIVSQFFWMDYIRQGWKSTCSYYYREVARNKQERVACLICARFLNSSPFDPHKGSKKTSVTIEEAETAPQVSGHWLNPSLVFFASERLQIRLGKQGDILKGGAT